MAPAAMRATANIAGPAYQADMSVVRGNPSSKFATTIPTNVDTIPNRVNMKARVVNCTRLNGNRSNGFGDTSVAITVKTATNMIAASRSRRVTARTTKSKKKKTITDRAAFGSTETKALAT